MASHHQHTAILSWLPVDDPATAKVIAACMLSAPRAQHLGIAAGGIDGDQRRETINLPAIILASADLAENSRVAGPSAPPQGFGFAARAQDTPRRGAVGDLDDVEIVRSEEHTSELQSLMRTSYAVFC